MVTLVHFLVTVVSNYCASQQLIPMNKILTSFFVHEHARSTTSFSNELSKFDNSCLNIKNFCNFTCDFLCPILSGILARLLK